MNGWMLALAASAPVLVTKTFTSSQSFTAPIGVSNLVTLSGKGQDGTPASTGNSSTYVDTVTGQLTGTGAHPGGFTWADFQGEAQGIVNAINGGSTSGGSNGVRYTAYINSNTYDISVDSSVYADAIPGTAYASYSAGWKTSGAILAGDYGQSFINYTRTIAATTGANTTGFGQTFAGGIGGPAATQNFTNVAVSGGASYNVIVPSGGSITITYYQ